MASDFVVVLVTLPADKNAEAFATVLVEERLAACVNVLPAMRSIYRWQGAIETADERQLLIKTSANCLSKLELRVGELHPYDVPEFVVLPIVSGSSGYLSWIAQSTGT